MPDTTVFAVIITFPRVTVVSIPVAELIVALPVPFVTDKVTDGAEFVLMAE